MKALLLIDLQNDFFAGGALAVPEAEQCIDAANYAQRFFNIIIASKDWHPADHLSFASQHEHKQVGDIIMLDGIEQILWPDHCVQHTKGAAFVANLEQSKIRHVISKGSEKNIDSYSAFFDNAGRFDTGFASYLKLSGIEEIFLAGVALEYCVKFSALDAVRLGFKTTVLIDACRGLTENTSTLEHMREHGVSIKSMADLIHGI